jgi:hypothetical protein
MLTTMLLSLVLARTAAPPPETPRATDLLRAKKMAANVARRLELPKPRGGGWVRAGTWGQAPPAKPALPTRRPVR